MTCNRRRRQKSLSVRSLLDNAFYLVMQYENAPVILEPGFWSKTSWIQICYGIWVYQIFVCTGLAFGFSAVAVPQLTEEFNATLAEQAFMVSVITLTSPIGGILSGLTVDCLGRRITLIVSVIPFAVSWAFIGFAKKPLDVIIGRTIAGIGIGMVPVARAFCAEISLPNIRGFLGVMPPQTIALGITIQAILGKLYTWRVLCYIAFTYSSILIILNLFLPESPHYILMKSNIEDTKNSIRKFRAKDYDVDTEVEILRRYKERKQLHKLSIKEYIKLLFLPSTCVPCTIMAFYFAFGQFSGLSVVTFHSVEFLWHANSSVDPYVGNIIFGMTRFVSGATLMALIIKIPRRPLAIVSAIILAVTCIGLGLFELNNKEPTVIPLVGFMMYIASANFGYITLPPMMLIELLPLEVRGLIGGVVTTLINVFMFITNTAYPYMKIHFSFSQIMFGFGIVAFSGAIFLYFFLPETKGLSLQEIEERYMAQRRSVLIPSRDE